MNMPSRGHAIIAVLILLAACSESKQSPTDTDPPSTSVAKTLSVSGGNSQVVDVGKPASAPTVRVVDQAGKGVAGVSVTFAVENGGGVITDSVVTTNADGDAKLGSWTVGNVEGANTLRVTASGLQPAFVYATAFDPCPNRRPLDVPGSLTGILSTETGCHTSSADARDSIGMTLTTQQSVKITLNATPERQTLSLSPTDGSTWNMPLMSNTAGHSATFRAIIPPGTFRGAITAATGIAEKPLPRIDYSITVENVPENSGECDPLVRIRTGVVTTQDITDKDCTLDGESDARYDSYQIVLQGGTEYTITATTDKAMDLEARGPDGKFIVSNNGNTNAATTTLTLVPNLSGNWELRVIARDAAHRGGYTLQSVH
jgi:hypothetical protein